MGFPVWLPLCVSLALPASPAAAGYPPLEVDARDLRGVVEGLAAISPPRNHRNPASMERAADLIRARFAAIPLSVEDEPFQVGRHRYRNLVASLRADLPTRFVVGAHYDVCGDQPGADDNASAVAGLLEIARLTADHRDRLRHRVDFVAFALEEPPFFGTPDMGSRRHAQALHRSGVAVRGMVSLEMIGYFSDTPGSQRFPVSLMRLVYPDTGNFIAVVGNLGSRGLVRKIASHMGKADIGVERLASPAWLHGVSLSDHASFWKYGYPAVMVTDTAFFRNPHYHLPTDTPDTLDYGRMAEVVKGMVWALLNLD